MRSASHNSDTIESYVRALISEIRLKGAIGALADVAIGAVFVGGGTPSVLLPDQIRRIGTALAENFDISRVREFSWEFEVKSATPERIEAIRDIGVTHARFGAQSFDPEYRELFRLTADIEQIEVAAQLLMGSFPNVSCDILYGASGQTAEHLLHDIACVDELGLNNVDVYPINNLVTQTSLDRSLRASDKAPVSGLTKHYLNILAREALRERGFVPHNGHGYVRIGQAAESHEAVVTDVYSFVYHEHTLGFPSHDLLGFGINSISSFRSMAAYNTSSFKLYVDELNCGSLAANITRHTDEVDAARPLALALPYHGKIPKNWIDEKRMEPEILEQLDALSVHGLVEITENSIALTHSGWEWYTNIMYLLLPSIERKALDGVISSALCGQKRLEPSGLEMFKQQMAAQIG